MRIFICLILMICRLAVAAEFDSNCLEVKEAELQKLKQLKIFDSLSGAISVAPLSPGQRYITRQSIPDGVLSPISAVKLPSGVIPPREFTQVGSDENCSFGLFLINPEKSLQPGDIMVKIDPHVELQSESMYKNIVKGMTHIAVVTRDAKGRLRHMDSPASWSGSSLRDMSYHIIRLRSLPPGIKSNNDLDGWLANPQKRNELKTFLGERKCKIEKIKYWLSKIKKNGYSYGLTDTEAVDPVEFQKMIERGESLSLYCSELALSAYSLAGISPPARQSIMDTFKGLDHFLKTTTAKEKIDRKKAIRNGLEQLLREYGGDGNFIVDLALRLILTPRKLKSFDDETKAIEGILDGTPAEMVVKLKDSSSSISKYLNQTIIRPTDYFNSIYQTDGTYSYVGTYLESGIPSPRGSFGNTPISRNPLKCREQ